MAKSGDPVIRVRDLVVGFGDTVVLNRVSLDVFRGEILGLVGGSGSGKSVFLRTIIGLLPKREGSIEILGANVDGLNFEERRAIERRCGVLFQHGALFSSLTVLENVQFPMREYLNISKGFMDDVARAKLDMVGLGARDAEKYPSELSGGMTKRAALARALALDPEIVFLDIGMPDMSGYDVAAQLRAGLNPTLAALTGWGAEADKARAQQAGFDHHLTKPATLADVNDVLLRHAGRR